MYSSTECRWVRVSVAKVDGTLVTLRYEGVFEFATVDLADMRDKPDLFRRITDG